MSIITAPTPDQATAASVWDHVWRAHLPASKDDLLLQRERRGPRWAAIEERLVAAFGSIDRLRTIELGSGRGDLSVMLAEHGAEVTLVDTNQRALDQAKSRFDRLGLTADFQRNDMFHPSAWMIGLFDVSISSGVIEHFSGADRSRAVAAHWNVLGPGGLAVISVPHARCLPYRVWKAYLELRGRWPYGYEEPYGGRELSSRAREVGFDSIETTSVGFWHSVSAHWGRDLFRRDVDWAHRRSIADRWMGLILLLFGRRPLG